MTRDHNGELLARIDRILAECDARQLPPLVDRIQEQGGVVELIPVAEALRQLGYPAAGPPQLARRSWLARLRHRRQP